LRPWRPIGTLPLANSPKGPHGGLYRLSAPNPIHPEPYSPRTPEHETPNPVPKTPNPVPKNPEPRSPEPSLTIKNHQRTIIANDRGAGRALRQLHPSPVRIIGLLCKHGIKPPVSDASRARAKGIPKMLALSAYNSDYVKQPIE
jgi:hypothetical protein